MEKTPLSDWGGSGYAPDGYCRGESEAGLLAGKSDSRDFRLLFAGRDGSGDTTRGVCVLAELLPPSWYGESETEVP